MSKSRPDPIIQRMRGVAVVRKGGAHTCSRRSTVSRLSSLRISRRCAHLATE